MNASQWILWVTSRLRTSKRLFSVPPTTTLNIHQQHNIFIENIYTHLINKGWTYRTVEYRGFLTCFLSISLFVKVVSVLKRGEGGAPVGRWTPLHGNGASPGEWSSGGEVAQGMCSPGVDIHPLAECPINLRMQSISQTEDWWWLTQDVYINSLDLIMDTNSQWNHFLR